MMARSILLCILMGYLHVYSQDESLMRVLFYNVENLFDTHDDSLKQDGEFLAKGLRYWNERKFYKKINQVYKVIIAAGEWNPPALVGLCEIENRYVLNKLVYETPLKKLDYSIIHFESPDLRGIDVALIFRENIISIDTALPIRVDFPFASGSRTRDILYARIKLKNRVRTHLIITHWPSRYGGHLETVPKREHVAGAMRHFIDSLFISEPGARIMIMGDFNDSPHENSLLKILGAQIKVRNIKQDQLYNLMADYINDPDRGTLKHKGSWNIFDQIITSGSLLDEEGKIFVSDRKAQIFSPDFLFEEDHKYLGKKPFRTFHGMKYQGGFSDHLPVYIDLKIRD